MKSRLRIFMLSFLALVGSLFGSASANAACLSPPANAGYFVGGSNFGYLYANQYSYNSPQTWYGYSADSNILHMLATASATHARVMLYGDAASCPTSGTYLYVGTIIEVIINP
jgi:hypothetical protein